MTDAVRCPQCGSEQVTGSTKGFGLGKAAAGAVLAGPVGFLGGLIGSKAVRVGCLACGHQWSPVGPATVAPRDPRSDVPGWAVMLVFGLMVGMGVWAYRAITELNRLVH